MRAAPRCLGAACVAALAGCGFELQARARAELQDDPAGRLPDALAARRRAAQRSIEASPTTRVVESAAQAQVVLQALAESREKVRRRPDRRPARSASSQLRLRFRFRAAHAGGQGADPRQRDRAAAATLTYTETAALAKEQEEAFLYRAMQSDIVSQVLRRLASVRLV